jgi:hypothetical protein
LAECPDGETEAERYRAQRRRCVRDCHAALIFGDITSPGSRGLKRDREALGKPLVWVETGITTPRHVLGFLGKPPTSSGFSSLGTGRVGTPGSASESSGS